MALVLLNRVQQTGTANTTVSFTLTGSVIGYQSFTAIGNGNTTYYAATDVSGNWEVGIGTYATGGTLTRTTILSSSNSGSAVTFSGTVNVFVTYPSERSVNLDGTGNVSALGTVSSGTWQGSTVGVAYGGTGVTSSSGTNSVVLRDASQNVTFNNYVAGFNATTAAAGTTTLTVASARNQVLVGSTTQTYVLPNATTLQLGQSFVFINNSSGVLTVKDNASTTIETVPSGGITQLGATSIATSAGSWGAYSFIPAAVDWGTNALNLASTVISGGTWQGGTIASGYGGTGLTTFTAANYALYSTSASALTAGTLPVPAGGTGQTSFSSGYIPYGNSSAALQSSSLLQFNGTYLQVGGGSVLGGATNPIAAFSQSANNYVQTYTYNPNTGTSASADFVAYGNNSTDAHGWADMGFTSSNYADSVYTVTGPNEAYLFGSGLNSSYTGNLVYATDSTGSANAHQWYVGGFTQAKSAYKMQLNSSYLELKTPVYVTGTTGTSGQVLTSAGSGAAPTWTTLSTGGGTVTTTDFTATSGQTVFTVNYTVGAVEVYRNGIKLGQADYTATNGTSITLATGAVTGDLIEVVTFSNLNLYSTITSETFSGTGSQTVFTMSAVPANAASLLVAIAGVVQDPTTYTVSSNTLTFSTAPPAASGNISVRYLGIASVGTVSSFSGGTTGLTPSSATTGAVTLGGVLNVVNGGTGVTTSTGSGNNVLSASPTLSGTAVIPTINSGSSTALTLQSNGTTAITVDTSQNVGIGTASPSQKLNIVGAATTNPSILLSETSGSSLQMISGASNSFIGTTGSTPLRFGTAFTEQMRIDSSGNVGIGTASPSSILDVVGSGNPTLTLRGSAGAYTSILKLQAAGGGSSVINATGASSDALIFQTTGTERMRIDSSGNLLVGNTTAPSPASKAYIFNAGGSSQNCLLLQNNANFSGVQGAYIYNANVFNDTGHQFLYCTDGTLRAEIRSNGGIANYSGNNVNLSDARTKTDIKDSENYLDKICSIPVRTFKYKDQKDNVLNLGVIAQEVEKVAPELVDDSGFGDTPEDGVPLKAIYQTDLTFALMKAIQEQQALITQLQADVAALKGAK